MRSTMRHFLKCALLLLVLSTGAWAQTPAKPADKPADKQAEHTLGPGDVIRVSVYQNPDLALETRISEQGQISFPLIGTVALGGLSTPAAEQRIAKMLRDGGFVLKPQVNVSLVQVRSAQVSILGQVGKPGRYPIDQADIKNITMTTAFAKPPIWFQSERGSQPGAPASWSSMNAQTCNCNTMIVSCELN